MLVAIAVARAQVPSPTATPQWIDLKQAGSGAARIVPPPADRATTATIMAPLSLTESRQMLRDAIVEIERAKPPVKAALTDSTRRVLRVVRSYVTRVDAANPTLPYYVWEQIVSQKMKAGDWTTEVFRPVQTIPNVTAVSLRADHGDLTVRYLAAIDRNGTKWEFNQQMVALGGEPRREICMLPLPTQLVEVQMTFMWTVPPNGRRPRLTIEAGVCTVAESARQAIYYLQVAEADLARGDHPGAALRMRKAFDLLGQYHRDRRP